MKIQIKSDLHNEHRPDAYRVSDKNRQSIMNPEADVLVLAGDITNYRDRFSLHHQLMRLGDRRVIYVPGNHEYYGASNAGLVVPELKAMYDGTNVHVLDRGFVIFGDVAFIGATLWSDLSNPLDKQIASRFLFDFRVPGLTPDWYNAAHTGAKIWIKSSLQALDVWPKRVVVTHHSPSTKSTHPRFKGDAANCCFHSNLEDLMLDGPAPQLWIHGHVHDPVDYQLGETRVIANPKGYPREAEENRRTDLPDHKSELVYNDDLIIEI